MEYYNYFTKQPYNGKNLEKLQGTKLQGGFLTFNQARKLGAKVIKGSKAVTKLSRMVQDVKNDSEFRSYPVFHVSQIEFRKEEK